MDLGGIWRAVPADDDLRRQYAEPGFDDGGWSALAVPGHWRSHPDLAESDGPLLYRREFEHPVPTGDRRLWLTFDGLFYQADIWLDGAYVGDTEGYFAPHTLDVTELLAARAEHTLAVEVTCAPQRDKTAKRNLTGVFQHWDCLDDRWNPGGIWRPVRIEETGPIRIRDLRVLCREASAERAVVLLRANLETVEPREAVIRSSVGAVDHELTQPLAAGENHVEWTVTIERPALWWPWSLGDQPLHDVVVEVAPAEAPDELSHRRRCRTGLRQVQLRDWICSINGERLYLKGSNHGPTRHALADATPEELADDVRLAKAAGLDLLRIHAHVTRPELYDAADEAGLLLWQDLPLQWGYSRSVRKQAIAQADAAVRLLGHHPSVAIWCGHNEPIAIDTTEVGDDIGELLKVGARFFTAMELPTFNRTILDRAIAKTLRKADGTRPVIPHSGVWPHLPQLDGTDTHIYFGWYHGSERDLPRFLATVPRMARFVTEFGAQSIPDTADFLEPERWPDLDWEHLTQRHKIQKTNLDKYVPADGLTFDEWREATQRYQALVIDRHIRELRRIKYRPGGGFAQFAFADAAPLVSWAVLDHERVPKLGYEALRAACAPVIVVADRLPASLAAGEALALDVHVVSDLRTALTGLRCTATLSWAGGKPQRWQFAGEVEADSVTRVGTLQFEAPHAAGALVLELEVTGGGLTGPVTDRDETLVTM